MAAPKVEAVMVKFDDGTDVHFHVSPHLRLYPITHVGHGPSEEHHRAAADFLRTSELQPPPPDSPAHVTAKDERGQPVVVVGFPWMPQKEITPPQPDKERWAIALGSGSLRHWWGKEYWTRNREDARLFDSEAKAQEFVPLARANTTNPEAVQVVPLPGDPPKEDVLPEKWGVCMDFGGAVLSWWGGDFLGWTAIREEAEKYESYTEAYEATYKAGKKTRAPEKIKVVRREPVPPKENQQ